jgi:hypothetical protein
VNQNFIIYVSIIIHEIFLILRFPNLQENGSLSLINKKTGLRSTIAQGQFCIDGIYHDRNEKKSKNNNSSSSSHSEASSAEQHHHHYSGSEWEQGIVVCHTDFKEPAWINPFYAAVNHTAALFLLLTAVVYMLLWKHQNIHGWLQFSYASALFCAFSLLAVVQVWSQQIYEYEPKLCSNLGWLIHFSILSSFFWLSSMNFDLAWRFSGRRYLKMIRMSSGRSAGENVKKFCFFAMFSVGFPVGITSVALFLDNYVE